MKYEINKNLWIVYAYNQQGKTDLFINARPDSLINSGHKDHYTRVNILEKIHEELIHHPDIEKLKALENTSDEELNKKLIKYQFR